MVPYVIRKCIVCTKNKEAKILDWRGRTELSTVDDYRYCLLVCPTPPPQSIILASCIRTKLRRATG